MKSVIRYQKIKRPVSSPVRSIATALVMAVLLVTTVAGGTAFARQDTPLLPGSFSDLAESVSDAVVNVRTETITNDNTGRRGMHPFSNSPFGRGNDPFNEFFDRFFNGPHGNRPYKHRSLGSGFVIDEKGYIVTNNHVVKDADQIVVKLKNGDEFDAEVVGTDPKTDIALLKIDGEGDLPSLKLGDSDNIRVGDWVVAIGSPFGLEQTVTAGIVSAKGRVIGAGPYDDFIQTDASINPGNSGGPLLNMKGEVVGINTAIVASGQGIGFAIPANLAKNIIGQLQSEGKVTRGWLGVGIQPVSKEIAEYYNLEDGKGALVTEVFPGDPADNAGIKPQDIILEVDGKKVEDSHDLSATIADIPVGEKVTIKALRDGKHKTFHVEIAKRDDEKVAEQQRPGSSQDEALGVQVADITEDVARQLNLNTTEGVYVSDIAQGSKADMAGIQRGDVIREINHKPIRNVDDYQAIIDKIDEGDPMQIVIRRMNGMFVVIKITR
ncbi:MAG: DegQ family serine endoprotease [Thermodesulfobacteriota bacterium]|nr:DegQ family serine endoprotease [Thermodesulfobacteriota bacterium]